MTYEFDGKYDLITMVGSVIDESGNAEKMLSKAISLLKDDGAIYLQMSRKGTGFEAETFCEEHGASVEKKFVDDTYGIHAEYYKIVAWQILWFVLSAISFMMIVMSILMEYHVIEQN